MSRNAIYRPQQQGTEDAEKQYTLLSTCYVATYTTVGFYRVDVPKGKTVNLRSTMKKYEERISGKRIESRMFLMFNDI